MRNRRFFSIEEVKKAVAEKLEELNNSPFKKREGCRYLAYSDEEQAFMKPLPLTPFEPAVWSTATVPPDYLISDGKNKYSIPFDLLGEQVDIRLTKNTVEVYYHGARVASHPRYAVILRDPVVQPQHMPAEHRKYLAYNSDDFTAWAQDIGCNTVRVVKYFLSAGREPEQGYKSCASLTKLNDKYGHDRLENACEKVLEYTSQPSIRIISTMLKNGQDKVKKGKEVPASESKPAGHGITRGAAYFRKGGAQS